ncbi:hypothetical protein JCM11491_001486 [Sporobolomyces phaffii]
MTLHDSSRKRTRSDDVDTAPKRRSRPRKRKARPPAVVGASSPPSINPSDAAARHDRAAHLNGFQPSHVVGYSTAASKWEAAAAGRSDPEAPPSRPRGATSLKLLTYNTWSSSPAQTHSQTRALVAVLASARADLVSLQEVSAAFEAALRAEGWVQAEWVLSSLDEYWTHAGKDGQGRGRKDAHREGVVVMIRRTVWTDESHVGFVKLKRANNEQAKALVVIKLVQAGIEVLRLATSHFSSLPQNARLRHSQYATTLSLLNARPSASHSVLLGDFNASSATELDLVSSTLDDVGPVPSKGQLANASGPGGVRDVEFRHRPTFGALYPLVTATAPKPRKPRRIDRIYVSKGTRHGQYRELGGDAIDGERDACGRGGKRYPSDHLAIGSRSRSQARSSIPETLEAAFRGVEHVARDVEVAARVVADGASEVERFGHAGGDLVRTATRDWRATRPRDDDGCESTDAEDGSAHEDDEPGNRPLLDQTRKSRVVPYEPADIHNAPNDGERLARRDGRGLEPDASRETIDDFRHDLKAAQDRVDDLFDLLEHVAISRSQLSGSPYHLEHLHVAHPTSSLPLVEPSTDRERRHLEKLVANVVRAKRDLIETYRHVCALAPRYAAVMTPRTGELGDENKVKRKFSTLNASFAKVLDFVEDRAQDEARERDAGARDERFLRRIETDEPGSDRAKRLGILKKAKADAKSTTFDHLELETWTGKWMVEDPFSELDRTAIQTIDAEENRRATRGSASPATPQVKNGQPLGKGVGAWLSGVLHRGTTKGNSRSPQQGQVGATPSMLEMGQRPSATRKSRSRRRSTTESHELSHGSRPRRSSSASAPGANKHKYGAESDAISTDSDEAADVDKQRRGLVPVRETQIDKELDSTEVPYQVPSDDTSGYVETPEELRQDQKERIESEHLWTPVVIVEWICIVVMILYWSITRGMGYQHSLGNVDLGRIVGHDAWSDTSPRTDDGSASPAATATASSPPPLDTDPARNESTSTSRSEHETAATAPSFLSTPPSSRAEAGLEPTSAPAATPTPTIGPMSVID